MKSRLVYIISIGEIFKKDYFISEIKHICFYKSEALKVLEVYKLELSKKLKQDISFKEIKKEGFSKFLISDGETFLTQNKVIALSIQTKNIRSK